MTRAAGVVVVAAVLACAGQFARAEGDAKVDKGHEVFGAQHCAMCHSIEGKGNKNKPLDGVGSDLTPDQIRKWITAPKEMKADTKMKAYPNLPPEDLDALVAYISSLKKKS